MTEAPPGGWLNYAKSKPHYGQDGWCQCTCDHCDPIGCGHVSNPAPCDAHPETKR